MPSLFVPPIVIPAGGALLIAACAIYHAYVLPAIPAPRFVVKIAVPQVGELA
jgi:hypothetical protein